MLANIAKFSAYLLFIASGWVVIVTPTPEGCRLKITNSGTPGFPNYGTTTCDGGCVAPNADPCTVSIYVGNYTSFACQCDGNLVLSGNACLGALSNFTGTWTIECIKKSCVSKCLKADLPEPGNSVFACTCPDA